MVFLTSGGEVGRDKGSFTFFIKDFMVTSTMFFIVVFRDMYVSFGGLLMMLKGDPSIAARFELDQRLFILIRKV